MNSAEVDGLIRYVMATGVPFRVTDINTPGVHSDTSYHYQQGHGAIGLAVDLAEPTPSSNTAGLLRIFAEFGPVESQLAELIYSGAPYSIKRGKRTTVAFGSATVLRAHWNHVHVAVPFGTVLKEKSMPDDPNLPNITGPVSFHPVVNSAGICQGYYIFSEKTGELHSFGPGAVYYGRSEVVS